MYTPFTFLHPKTAFRTLFGPNSSCPIYELLIFFQVLIVDDIGFFVKNCLTLGFLHLITCQLNMVDHVTLKAILNATLRTKVVRLILVLLDVQILAVLTWALDDVRVLISNLLPLKLLETLVLLCRQNFLQVGQGDRKLTFGLRANDGKLLSLDTVGCPRQDALLVVHVRADAKSENLTSFICEKGHLTDLAQLTFCFLGLASLNLFQLC